MNQVRAAAFKAAAIHDRYPDEALDAYIAGYKARRRKSNDQFGWCLGLSGFVGLYFYSRLYPLIGHAETTLIVGTPLLIVAFVCILIIMGQVADTEAKFHADIAKEARLRQPVPSIATFMEVSESMANREPHAKPSTSPE